MDRTALRDGRAPARHAPARVIAELNREWAALCGSRSADDQARRWAGRSPALAGVTSLAEVQRRTRAASTADADEIIGTLLRAGQAGDWLARRAVFQLMLGAAVRRGFTRTRLALGSPDEVGQEVVAALWDAIASYPLRRRPRRIAANLVLETAHRLWSSTTTTIGRQQEVPADLTGFAGGEPGAAPAAVELLEVVAWGVDVGAVSRDDAALLIRVYCPPPGRAEGSAVAAEVGLSWPAVRQRCSRAVRALTGAVARSVAQGEPVG